MRLIGYVRVSQEDENPENQRFAIYEWGARQGHRIEDVFMDVGISGAVPPQERPGFKRVLERLEDADGIVVYALDRIARSLIELFEVVKLMEAKGKVVVSIREEWLQQLDPRMRGLIIAILGWAAEMERELVRERTREALRRLKAEGKRLGRPRTITENTAMEAISKVEKGYTLKDAAKVLNVGYTTLVRFINANPVLKAQYYEARLKAKARLRRVF